MHYIGDFMKKIFILMSILISINASAGSLVFTSKGNDVTKEQCNQIDSITSSLQESTATYLGVAASSVHFLRSQIYGFAGGTCCVVMDTPKGPQKVFVVEIYQDSETKKFTAHSTFDNSFSNMCF